MKLPGIRNGNKKSHICRATGGRVPEDISEGADPMMDSVDAEGGFAAPRLDRPAPKKSSAPVNVNVTVMNSKPAAPDLPPPMPPMAGPPPPPMGGLPPPGGPPMPMRKDGGRVNKDESTYQKVKGGIADAVTGAAKVAGTAAVVGHPISQAKMAIQGAGYAMDPKKAADDISEYARNKAKPERASGGRIDAGAGGGLGRLEKAKAAK